MKKTLWIKIVASLIAAIPPVVVLILNYPVIVSRADRVVSIAALLVAIILTLIFKDAVKRFFQTPGYLKFSIVILILSLISLSLGDQMFKLSLTATISGLCALPLNIWYNYLTKPVTSREFLDVMKTFGKENNNEQKSDEENKTTID